MMLPIQNDVLLILAILVLFVCVLLEYLDGSSRDQKKEDDSSSETAKTSSSSSSSSSTILESRSNLRKAVRRRFSHDYTTCEDNVPTVPVHYGRTCAQHVQADVLRLNRYMPENVVRAKRYMQNTAMSSNASSSLSSLHSSSSSSLLIERSTSLNDDVEEEDSRASIRAAGGGASPQKRAASMNKVEIGRRVSLMVAKLPFLEGCEPESVAAKQMKERFPDAPITDIVRFLVARKGDVSLASEMYEKASAWHLANLPLKRNAEVVAAINTRCFFPFGKAKDGTPVLYFRGALYDNTKASPECFVLAAAHAIEFALRNSSEINVTVLVHANYVPGAPNASADMGFIKGFISTLSDNFPERLKRLAIYPFPWYGRAIWSVLKVFVDKRTQEKVSLLSYSGNGVPNELLEFMDPREMPECCGGLSKAPIVDLIDTLVDDVQVAHGIRESIREVSLHEDEDMLLVNHADASHTS